jgi:YjbE family integral membrane protein
MDLATGASLLQIIWINIVLSGDNAMVIALACRSLKGNERRMGIVLGAAAAVLLRIVFTLGLSEVLYLPYARAIGGLLLLVIAVKLLIEDDAGEDTVHGHESLMKAVGTIMLADIVMSLDNVVAIAAVANGSFLLIVVGLTLSVPIVVGGSAMIVEAIRRFPAVVWAGSGFLGWIGGETFGIDSAVHPLIGSLVSLPVIAGTGAVLVLIFGWGIRAARQQQRP